MTRKVSLRDSLPTVKERMAGNMYRAGRGAFSSVNPWRIPAQSPTFRTRSACAATVHDGSESSQLGVAVFEGPEMSTLSLGVVLSTQTLRAASFAATPSSIPGIWHATHSCYCRTHIHYFCTET